MPYSTAGADGLYTAPGRPRRIAHRGLALDGAENTARAMDDALTAGATHLETDAQTTSDGVALAFHDPTLDRVTDASGAVAERTWDSLRPVRTRGDEPLLRLDDLLGDRPDVPVNIDVKARRNIDPVVEAVRRTGAVDRVCLASFDDTLSARAARLLRERTGTSPLRSAGRAQIAAFYVLAGLLAAPDVVAARALAGIDFLQVPVGYGPITLTTRRIVAAAHRVGREVHVWTIDDPARMRDLLALGVDGIVTNRIDLFPYSPTRPS